MRTQVFSHTITDMIENKTMDKNRQKALGVAIIILLIGLIGWYIVRDVSPQDSRENQNSGENIEDTVSSGDITALIESGDAEIQEIPVEIDTTANTLVKPELSRNIVIPARFNGDAETIMRNNIEKFRAQLNEDSDSFEAWSNLAIQYKIIDDFEGAVEIWEYLSLVTTDNIETRLNLGNVYHFELKEYEKSEKVFKEVLNIKKHTIGAYTGLHELYKYSYKTDTTLALDILKEGADVMTEDIDLRILLASYYTELGMKTEATAVYEEALAKAEAIGNTNLVTIIKAAITSLK